jgi:hypothetical protein
VLGPGGKTGKNHDGRVVRTAQARGLTT